MKDKYINGMKEIEANEDFKNRIINNIDKHNLSDHVTKSYKGVKLNKFFKVAACSLVVATVVGVGLPNILKTTSSSNTQSVSVKSVFSGFELTVYAADNSTIDVNPNVEFGLGEYYTFLNSNPGLPLKIECDSADVIKLTVSNGTFMLWEDEVKNIGKEIEVKSGDKIYWSPLETSQNEIVENSNISIFAYKDNIEIGKQDIVIEGEFNNEYQSIKYTGKLIK